MVEPLPPEPPPPPPRFTGAIDAERRALGERFAQERKLSLYRNHLPHLGNDDGRFAPMVAMPDGGLILTGTQVTPRSGRAGLSTAVAVRLDAAGAVRWEHRFARAGYPESEGGSLAYVDGGVIAYVRTYANPAWGAVIRVVRLDDTGAITWDFVGRGKGGADTPFADELWLTPAGTVEINGHIVTVKGQPALDWRGELSADGALTRDEIGGPDPRGLL